jgi:hypothetical protein
MAKLRLTFSTDMLTRIGLLFVGEKDRTAQRLQLLLDAINTLSGLLNFLKAATRQKACTSSER